MDLPISETLDRAQNGTFHYLQDIRDASIRGVFVFSFYTHFPWGHPDKDTLAKNIYVKGIQLYVQAIQRADSVFGGWKVVLYTDKYTYDWLRRLEHEFVSNPTVLLCVVDWPYYQRYSTEIWKDQGKGDVLRCMRLRAFFDFSHVPVFMRDADTLWAMQMTQYAKRLEIEAADLYEWEANFLRGALNHPNTFIFGTSLIYKRFWHMNKLLKLEAPLGAFAGFQSTIPTVPCFQSNVLWEQTVNFILERSKRKGERKPLQMSNKTLEDYEVFTNNSDTTSLGKDEQILLFLILPACISNSFFFELDLFEKRNFALRGKKLNNPNYTSFIFERGNNANLRRLFTLAIEQGFKTNLESERKAFESRNEELKQARGNEILDYLSRLNDPLKVYTASRMSENTLYHTASQYQYILQQIMNALRPLNESGSLREKKALFDSAEMRLHNKRTSFVDAVFYAGPDYPLDAALAELQALVDERSRLAREFLETVLAAIPREELLKRVGNTKKLVERLLDWYDGKPLAAGGGKTRRRGKNRRTRKN